MKPQTLSFFAALFVLLSLSAACSRLGTGTAENPVEEYLALSKKGNYKEVGRRSLNRKKCIEPTNPRCSCKDVNNLDDCILDYEKFSADEKQIFEDSMVALRQAADKGYTVSPISRERYKSLGYEELTSEYSLYEVEFKSDTGRFSGRTVWMFYKSGDKHVLVEIAPFLEQKQSPSR